MVDGCAPCNTYCLCTTSYLHMQLVRMDGLRQGLARQGACGVQDSKKVMLCLATCLMHIPAAAYTTPCTPVWPLHRCTCTRKDQARHTAAPVSRGLFIPGAAGAPELKPAYHSYFICSIVSTQARVRRDLSAQSCRNSNQLEPVTAGATTGRNQTGFAAST
jgi:hypothetical protein